MPADPADSLVLPLIAFRGLWDKFAGPRSLGAIRRAYERGVPSLVRFDIVNDPALNARRLPLYVVTPEGPDGLFAAPRSPFHADVMAVTMTGDPGDTGAIARWDGNGWTRVGVYISSSATRRGVRAGDLDFSGLKAGDAIVMFESANVIDDVATGVREPAPSDDSVFAALRDLGGPDPRIFRVSDLVELDLLAQRLREAA